MSKQTREQLEAAVGTASLAVLLLVLMYLPNVLGTN